MFALGPMLWQQRRACYWLKYPPIRNVRARFYDMVAETSGDAKDPVAHGLGC